MNLTLLILLSSFSVVKVVGFGSTSSCFNRHGGVTRWARFRRPFPRRLLSSLGLFSSNHDDNTLTNSQENEASQLRAVTFRNIPKDQEPNLLADFLLEIGACSASIVDAHQGTDREEPVFGEPTNDPWQDSLQWAAPLWNACHVTAHFPPSANLQGVLDMIQDVFGEKFRFDSSMSVVPDKDWVVHVQQSWPPILVGHFLLRFPWHDDNDVQQVLPKTTNNIKRNKAIELQLQGGIAFGTGEHPTTQLCLEWLHDGVQDLLQAKNDNSIIKVLDYGAGSGVLGIGACAMDRKRVQAVGIDIDVDACDIANANAAQNCVDMRNYLPPLVETSDPESKSLLLKAHNYAKKRLDERGQSNEKLILPLARQGAIYDVCVANILAGPLVTLAPVVWDSVQPGGKFGLSGILSHQGDMVVDAYRDAGFDHVKVARELNGWVLVTGEKRHDIDLPIVLETNDVLVINKPAGVAHHDDGLGQPGVVSLLREQQRAGRIGYQGRLYGIHRLDRVTSGCLIFAKSADAAKHVAEAFREGRVSKLYTGLSASKARKKQGLVQGNMVRGRRKSWMLTRERDGNNFAKTRFYTAGLGGLKGEVLPEHKESSVPLTLILFRPYTGKTHQLRVAAKSVGLSLLGDPVYRDGSSAATANRTYLHSCAIRVPRKGIFNDIVAVCPPEYPFWSSDGQQEVSTALARLVDSKCEDETLKEAIIRAIGHNG